MATRTINFVAMDADVVLIFNIVSLVMRIIFCYGGHQFCYLDADVFAIIINYYGRRTVAEPFKSSVFMT